MRVGAVAFGDGDMATPVEKHVAQKTRVAELPALGVPLRRNVEESIVTFDADGRVDIAVTSIFDRVSILRGRCL